MEKIIYLYACDRPISYRGTTIQPHSGAHNHEFNFLLEGDSVDAGHRIPICLNTRVSDMAVRILAALGTENTIRALKILSHGAPGTVSIGENIAARTQARLSPLRGRFAANSEGVFLYGCRIASEEMGSDETHIRSLDQGTCTTYYDEYSRPEYEFERYMRGHFSDRRSHEEHGMTVSGSVGFTFICSLAETLGVNVTAAVDRQTDIPVGRGSHRVDSTGYEGQYVTVTPTGTHTLQGGRTLREVFTTACVPYDPSAH